MLDALSSGEKQLFVRALSLKMLDAQNGIILIDEPETSLHPSEPRFFTEFKKTKKPENWDDFGPIKNELRKHFIEQEQRGQCAYCESAITNRISHTDHIRPQNRFPRLFDEYVNLCASCNNGIPGAEKVLT